ncbi:MAG: lipopolysaccharide biosynthesis protein [Candidatus Hodarchaeales archaeon]|jgi:O-antigen/teichoic acid export membrane protein
MSNNDLAAIKVIKKQARDFFILSALGIILVKLRGIIFVKIFSTFLGTMNYGYFFFIQNNGMTLATLISFNMQTAIYRFTSESIAKKDKDQSSTFLMTSIFLSLFIAVSLNAFLLILSFFQLNLFSSENYLFDLLAIGAFGAVIANKRVYFSLQTIIPYLTLVGSIIFGILLNLSVFGLIVAQVIGYLILLIPLTVKLFLTAQGAKFDLVKLKAILTFSLPGLSVILVGSVKIFALNLLLKEIFGNEALGTYSIALSIANILGMFDYVVSLSYPTIIMRNFDLGNHAYIQNFANRMSRIYLILMVALTLLFSALSPILVLIFSSWEFSNSALLIPIILFALVVQALARLTCFGPLLKKKTKEAGVINTISHLIHLGIIFLMIPLWGSLGAAISLFLFNLVTFGTNFALSQSVYPVRYEKGKFIGLTLSLFISLLIGLFFLPLNNTLVYSSLVISFCVFAGLVIFLRLIKLSEIRNIFAMFKPVNINNEIKN